VRHQLLDQYVWDHVGRGEARIEVIKDLTL
jgi:hypothetical protein